ncbi:MAG TPA: peptidoglycan-binding protein [Candidatus Udaeobacter sp.]|nr:peptidoglycan-binding protein [Candidatus Udaeobacter sp.]
MKLSRFPALCSIAVLAMAISTGTGQTNAPVPQNGPRPVPGNVVRATNARPNNSNPQYIRRGPANVGQRPSTMLPTQMQNQQPRNFYPNYPRFARQLNPRPAVIPPRPDTAARQTQPIAEALAKNEVAENQVLLANARPNVATDAQRHMRPQEGTANRSTTPEARQTRDKDEWRKGNSNNHRSYFDALRAHRHEWHHRDWWKQNCNTIVFVTGGYYFLDAGYWYPAWGYDPLNSYYDYDGPIYTYGNLLPDQVIANVQAALQDAGYYFGAITGSLSVETRAALVNFQRDQGLSVTGAIDEPTVAFLGLY